MSITNATRLSDFAAGIGTEGAILKIDNANQRVGIGTQLPNQMLTVAGIVSATQYIGDGSQLEGITSAGLGTAIDETEGSAGAVIYFTDDLLTVSETTTVNPPASASAAYTQYRDVKLDDSVDLIIETGDDFIPDILGFGDDTSDPNAAGNGVFDEVYAGVIKNKNGLGAPAFANGLTSVGVITATGGFSGNLTGDVTGNVNNSTNLILKTDNAERVRIDSTGKVGISTGNIDPSGNQLLIRGASTVGTNKGHIMLTGDGSVVGEGPQIVFSESGPGANWAGAYIGHTRQGGGSVGDLRFGTRAAVGDANTVPTERLRIGSAGQIGLSGANYGTSGQVLTSQGSGSAVQWANAAGGAWEVVSTTVLSGSTSDLQLYGWSNNYAQYKVVFNDCNNTSDIRMKIRFYMDATSGNNGTLNTSSNYKYCGNQTQPGSNGATQLSQNNQDYIEVYADNDGGDQYNGELIFPMKTTSYSSASICYGTMIAHNYSWQGISAKLNADLSKFLTGIHIYFIEKTTTNPSSPAGGRITLLRMKYS